MNIRSLAVAIVVMSIVTGACFAQGACSKSKEMKIWGGLDSKPKVAESYKPEKVKIGIGSHDLLELRGGAAGYSLAEREVAVYNRLTEAISHGPVCARMVRIGQVRSAPTVYVGRVRLVSAYASDAKATGTTQAALADAWRASLAAVLPQLTKATGDQLTNAAGTAGVVKGAYELAVGGVSLFRLRGADGFASLAARAQAAEGAIVTMLSESGSGAKAAAATEDGQCVVVFRNIRLVSVTGEDAAANKTTPQLLAQAWAAKLNGLLDKQKASGAPAAQ